MMILSKMVAQLLFKLNPSVNFAFNQLPFLFFLSTFLSFLFFLLHPSSFSSSYPFLPLSLFTPVVPSLLPSSSLQCDLHWGFLSWASVLVCVAGLSGWTTSGNKHWAACGMSWYSHPPIHPFPSPSFSSPCPLYPRPVYSLPFNPSQLSPPLCLTVHLSTVVSVFMAQCLCLCNRVCSTIAFLSTSVLHLLISSKQIKLTVCEKRT